MPKRIASTTTAGFASVNFAGDELAQRVSDEAEPDAGRDRIGQRHRTAATTAGAYSVMSSQSISARPRAITQAT